MSKLKWLFSILIILAIGLYLNFAYSHIYKSMSVGYLDFFSGPATFNLTPSDSKTARPVTYVAIGDSLTAGSGANSLKDAYPYLIAKESSQKNNLAIKLINFAVPGSKTDDVIKSQLQAAIDAKPNIVTILIGVNDIHQMVGIADYQKNLQTIFTALSKTNAKIFILTLPYLGDKKLMLSPYRAYFDQQTKRYNKILQMEAGKINATIIDLYSLTHTDAMNSANYYSRDGFHPSANTYAGWAKLLYAPIDF